MTDDTVDDVSLPTFVEGGDPQSAPAEQLQQPLSNSYASVCEILRDRNLRSLVLSKGALEFNEQTLTPTVGREPLREEQLSRVREMAERELRDCAGKPIRLSKQNIEQAAVQVARENAFHPVAEYLRGLEWDGESRLDRVATEVLGVDTSYDGQPLAATQLRMWMIAAVARALKPGCQVDTVLVLTGAQGLLKSTFFRVLASADWFSDAPVDMHDKDSRLLLRRCWILEWAELDSLQRARSANSVKAFITARVDQVRPPYGKAITDFPRTCIIVGTTNQTEFLSDATGSRRYWVVQLDRRVDVELLTRWRDQLWAEAVDAYLQGQRFHLSAEDEQRLAATNGGYEEADPWEEPVGRWLAKRVDEVSVGDVLCEPIGKDKKDWRRADENRVGAILKKLGWLRSKNRPRVDGARVRLWCPPPAKS